MQLEGMISLNSYVIECEQPLSPDLPQAFKSAPKRSRAPGLRPVL